MDGNPPEIPIISSGDDTIPPAAEYQYPSMSSDPYRLNNPSTETDHESDVEDVKTLH